jgi:hypothetical protein
VRKSLKLGICILAVAGALLAASLSLAQFTVPQNGSTRFSPVTTTNPISVARRSDWTSVGVQGGIPSRSTVCASLTSSASSSTINSAIASCPSGEVVSLAAGTYNLTSGITFGGHSNVTLRGAGPQSTKLVFTGSGTGSFPGANISVYGDSVSQSSPSNLTSWSGGYSQGSTSITLSSASGLSSGHMVILDQLNDSSDTGNVYVCSACSSEGTGGVSRSNRAQVQVTMVTGVSGSTVSVSPAIYMPNWRTSQTPQAYWPTNQISMDGIEDLQVNGSGSSAQANITFGSAVNCWVRDVVSLYGNRDHVWLWYAAHISVLNSYFYGLHAYGTTAYGIETDNTSADLIQNNILQHIVTPLTIGNDSGDVYAYNYITDDYYTSSSNWMQAGIFPHQEGTCMDLAEGNVTPGWQSDDVHGTHIFMTVFRNYSLGYDNPTRTNNTIPINTEAYGRYDNYVGNVLGHVGTHSYYADLVPTSNGHAIQSIYVIGWSGETGGSGSRDDSLTVASMMRWGNYDIVNGSVQWNSSEVPSGLSPYGNPVPSNHSLPSSLYLTSAPSFWGMKSGYGTTPPWPPIGPDVSGGTGPGGHVYEIPAELCYDNTSSTGGILNFSASACYQNP